MTEEIVDSGDELIKSSAFFTGMIWSITDYKKLLDYPISNVFDGIIYGSLCSVGAGIIGGYLPRTGKPLFAGLLAVSALYHTGKVFYSYINKDDNIKLYYYRRFNVYPSFSFRFP